MAGRKKKSEESPTPTDTEHIIFRRKGTTADYEIAQKEYFNSIPKT